MTTGIARRSQGGLLFDDSPIALDGFKLRARSVQIVGKPSAKQFQAALVFAAESYESAPYWIGDLLEYAESRTDWQEKRDQILAVTGLAEKTLRNLSYVARRVEEPERLIAPSPAHAAEVAALERPEQTRFLEKARMEGWTRRELRTAIKVAKRTRVIEGQAKLAGKYRVIYADPPWSYRNSTPTESGEMTRAAEAYPTMTIEELIALPVAAHAVDDAVLFLWTTAPLLLQNPGPRDVIEAWGFTYKTNYVWNKVLGMPGSYSFVEHEHLIVATRGQGTPDVPIQQIGNGSVQTIRRDGEHSEKPEHFRKLIERLYPTGNRLELFARRPAPTWAAFGNDPRLWGQ